ncbi:hypothetical protein WMY93_019635 [Mugilogobius chulae]|uniref:Calcitonin receptor n=1 Tax=Mugilogobius chulae TaxID=88201 RepID=A0AAW0NPQ1_9GOBI
MKPCPRSLHLLLCVWAVSTGGRGDSLKSDQDKCLESSSQDVPLNSTVTFFLMVSGLYLCSHFPPYKTLKALHNQKPTPPVKLPWGSSAEEIYLNTWRLNLRPPPCVANFLCWRVANGYGCYLGGLFCPHSWDGLLCWPRTPAGTSVTLDCPGRPPQAHHAWYTYTFKRVWHTYTFKRLHCGAEWDGFLCWEHTPAGGVASQKCPASDWTGDPSETVRRFCSEEGQWLSTNSSVCAVDPRTAAQLSADVDIDSTHASVSVSSVSSVQAEDEALVRRKILDNQYKCFEKMHRDPAYNSTGPYCSRNWDGWLCWDDTPVGTLTSQNCPNYFVDFDPTEKATKFCGEDGLWFRHPDTNRTWSNYTRCNENTKAKLKSAYILFYMAIVGHALSIASLLVSLAIFFYFSLHFFHMYMLGCNYFWMLCEGIYLHTLIVVAVFAEEQHLHWSTAGLGAMAGLGVSLVPASIHAVARKTYFDDNCWMSVETHLLYAVHGPIVAALLVNLFFLLNIIRVLVTKLRDTHRAESNMYMKAVRATLILVPLLGIQFVIIPWRPENRVAGEVYEYIMHILMHYQGLLVATIFCFFNGEVQAALKRQWVQYKMQWGQRRKEHCSMRSTSYTATSITEVPAFMFPPDGHDNGRQADHSELLALKMADTYA